MRQNRSIPFTLVTILLLLSLLLLLPGCAGLRPTGGQRSSPGPAPAVISPEARHILKADPYSAAHSFYCGLVLPLDLVSFLPLAEKYRILMAAFSTGSADSAGNVDSQTGSVEIRIPGYFSRGGELIIRSVYDPDPPRMHWLSNAVYSPLTGGPLRGKGEFLPEGMHPGNISDLVLLHENFAVRITEIHTHDGEALFRKRHEYNNLADLYLHDGKPDNDYEILPLLQKAYREAPSPLHRVIVELTGIQYLTSLGKYEEAKSRLRMLIPVLPALNGEVRDFFRYTYEEYALTRSLDTRNPEHLIEFNTFLRG